MDRAPKHLRYEMNEYTKQRLEETKARLEKDGLFIPNEWLIELEEEVEARFHHEGASMFREGALWAIKKATEK